MISPGQISRLTSFSTLKTLAEFPKLLVRQAGA
jgi:hypothetical protein